MGNAVCPSTLKLSARAINARGFSFRTCTSLQQREPREHHRLQCHSSGACDQVLGQCCPGGQPLWGVRNCESRFHLHVFQRVRSMLKISCACVLVVTRRDSREGQTPLSCTCPLLPLPSLLLRTKNRELTMSEKGAGQRGEGRSCSAGGSG